MYHIGVGFEVVRFDKMGLPGPLFMKRTTGKFTLTFYCVLTNCFTLKSTIMVQLKLKNPILHFTSFNVLESIIKDNGLHFWATRYDCMNDPLEYKWLYEPLKEKIAKDNPTLQGQVDFLYEIFPYVISFSGASNHQYLWEKYGQDGHGVCLVMNRKIMQPTVQSFIKDGDYLADVKYATEQDKIEKLSEATLEYRMKGYGTANNSEEFVDEIACCPFVKCEEWNKEEEIRYIRIRERNMHASYSNSKKDCVFSYPEDTSNVKYRNRNGKQIPYLDIALPKSSLEGIVIGKHLDFKATKGEIKTLLQQTDYQNISIDYSKY